MTTTITNFNLAVVLGPDPEPTVLLHTTAQTGPIGVVVLTPPMALDRVAVQSRSVQALLGAADAFREAARRLQAAQIAAEQPETVAVAS